MRVIYFIIVFMLAIVMPQAHAIDLGDALKDAVNSTTTGKTSTDSKKASTSNTPRKKKFSLAVKSQAIC
jgi:hypothetical protein